MSGFWKGFSLGIIFDGGIKVDNLAEVACGVREGLSMLRIIIAAFLGFGITVSYAAGLPMPELDAYQKAISEFPNSKDKTSLEPLFRKGTALADQLVKKLEDLSEQDYELLQKKMPGFAVNREETVFILPESDFFLALAEKKGLEADIAFFKFLKQYKPDSVWPVYINQQTDYSGCTIYGDGKLTGLYKEAINLKVKHNNAYVQDINQFIGALERELLEEVCACDDADSVKKEFELFLKEFPNSAISPKVQSRLSEVKQGKSRFRFNCISG
jgi:hypothetical protein